MKNYIFMFVCFFAHNAIVQGMQADTTQIVELFQAIEKPDNERMKALVNAHPHMVNTYQRYKGPSHILFGDVTPLHVAVNKDNVDGVNFLLISKADPNRKTIDFCEDEDQTPLHFVRSVPVTKVLLQYGALVDTKNRAGYTPLHTALFHPRRRYNIEVAQCLVAHGADINQRHSNSLLNETLLHDAVRAFDSADSTIPFLLKNGADRTLRNKDGKTPLDLVKNKGMLSSSCNRVVELLEGTQ